MQTKSPASPPGFFLFVVVRLGGLSGRLVLDAFLGAGLIGGLGTTARALGEGAFDLLDRLGLGHLLHRRRCRLSLLRRQRPRATWGRLPCQAGGGVRITIITSPAALFPAFRPTTAYMSSIVGLMPSRANGWETRPGSRLQWE